MSAAQLRSLKFLNAAHLRAHFQNPPALTKIERRSLILWNVIDVATYLVTEPNGQTTKYNLTNLQHSGQILGKLLRLAVRLKHWSGAPNIAPRLQSVSEWRSNERRSNDVHNFLNAEWTPSFFSELNAELNAERNFDERQN